MHSWLLIPPKAIQHHWNTESNCSQPLAAALDPDGVRQAAGLGGSSTTLVYSVICVTWMLEFIKAFFFQGAWKCISEWIHTFIFNSMFNKLLLFCKALKSE